MGTCLAVEGASTAAVFEAYMEKEKVLVPTLQCGQSVVMDDLSAHKGGRVKDLVESAGCESLLSTTVPTGPQPHRRNLYENVKPQSGL